MSRYKREMLGESLHVALRKCCDSGPTSAAWNAINKMPDGHWGNYVSAVYAAIDGQDDPTGALRATSLKWAEDNRRFDSSAVRSLASAFFRFDEEDWRGMAGFLEYCEVQEPDLATNHQATEAMTDNSEMGR